jgi:hypothetical protein
MQMGRSWTVGLISAALIWAAACGNALDDAGGQPGYGGAGNYPADDAGVHVGADAEISSDLAAEESDAPLGPDAGMTFGPEEAGTSVDLCPGIEQVGHELNAVISGAQSSGSATAARELLQSVSPQSPLPSQVRTQDFLNYYVPSFETAAETPQVHLQLRKSVASYYELMVAVQAPVAARPPALDLIVALDNTESMETEGLARATALITKLALWLGDNDSLHLITATPDSSVMTYTKGQTPEVPADLAPEMDVKDLLTTAYAHAEKTSAADKLVVLIADGEGDPTTLPTSDLRLAAFGTGPAARFGHRLMRNASRDGMGPYVYLDSTDAASSLNLDRLLLVSQEHVGLKLLLPWYFTFERPFAGGMEAPSAVEEQYLSSEQVTVFLFRLAACHADAPNTYGGTILADVTATPVGGTAVTFSVELGVTTLLGADSAELAKSSAVLAYAEALRSLDPKRLEHALGVVEDAQGLLTEKYGVADTDLGEISTLLASHPGLPQSDAQ